jgi:hypothetical protein
MQKKSPNGEIARIESSLKQIEANQNSMAQSLESLSALIMDPNDGIVVSANKNTEYRKEMQRERKKSVGNLKAIMRWKKGMDKALWVLFSTVVAIIVKLIFYT